MKLLIVVAACAALGVGVGVGASQEVMKQMTLKFGKAFEQCKSELQLPDSVQEALANFWKEDFVLESRDAGCLIMCLSAKLNLHDDTGKLHQENAKEFVKSHGGDDATAQTMIDLVHTCEDSAPSNPDGCLKVLEIAKCFKAGIHKLNWAPDMEVLAEI